MLNLSETKDSTRSANLDLPVFELPRLPYLSVGELQHLMLPASRPVFLFGCDDGGGDAERGGRAAVAELEFATARCAGGDGGGVVVALSAAGGCVQRELGFARGVAGGVVGGAV